MTSPRALGTIPLLLMILLCVDCDRRPRSVPIAVGQTIRGQLDSDDWTDVFADGSYSDIYEIELTAGQQVTVELSSSAFDTYLSLMRGPGDQIIDNDDIAPPDDTNSRLTYRAQAPGRYFIVATTYRRGETGPYTLRVSESSTQETQPGSSESKASR